MKVSEHNNKLHSNLLKSGWRMEDNEATKRTNKAVEEWWDRVKNMQVDLRADVNYSIDKCVKGIYTFAGRVNPRHFSGEGRK